MTNADELIERAADSLEFLESTGGGKRVQAQVIRDLATALRAADQRIAELEECVRVARRAVELGNDSIARVDRTLASWHKVFPGENPAIARRMVEDRVRAESAQIIAELERDRERLDWLEVNAKHSRRAGYGNPRGMTFFINVLNDGPTLLRAAIDAAMGR